jgi:hypothetical protein
MTDNLGFDVAVGLGLVLAFALVRGAVFGHELVTLRDAAHYIRKLSKAEQDLEEWQAAVEALLLVVEPTMMARIGVLRALNRNVERVFSSSRKNLRWGKRKLKTNEDPARKKILPER